MIKLQNSVFIRKQKSETSASSTTTEHDHVLIKQSTVIGISTPAAPPTGPPQDLFVGKWGKFPFKMRKEANLTPVCEALRTNGEMAAFVALCTTTIGHVIVDFQVSFIYTLYN